MPILWYCTIALVGQQLLHKKVRVSGQHRLHPAQLLQKLVLERLTHNLGCFGPAPAASEVHRFLVQLCQH